MTAAPADGVTATPKLYGGQPNEAGWFPIVAIENGKGVLVGAAHIKDGVSLEDATAAWQKNDGAEVGDTFDAVLDGSELALEKLKPSVPDAKKGAPIEPGAKGETLTPDKTKPGAKGNADDQAQFDPTRSSRDRATGRRTGRKNRRFDTPQRTQKTHAKNGSRKGKKGGQLENSIWAAVAGYNKAFFEGIFDGAKEIAFSNWDTYGAILDYFDKDYSHDYKSAIGRALGEMGQNIGDILVQGVADQIRGVGRMYEDLERGDYYAAGAEAQSLPTPGANPLGAVRVVAKVASMATRRARHAAKLAKLKRKLKGKIEYPGDIRRDPTTMTLDVDGQPDFSKASFHDFRLEQNMVGRGVSSDKQFRRATKDLKAYMKENPETWNIFSPKEQIALKKAFKNMEIEGIGKSNTIGGFTWHHSSHDVTVLQLISYDVHRYWGHIGGRSMAGG